MEPPSFNGFSKKEQQVAGGPEDMRRDREQIASIVRSGKEAAN
jgi:hypothetical protein